jgi:periplasmic protein CpxP/Spy
MYLFGFSFYDDDIERKTNRKPAMKLKLMPILIGAITLTGSVAAIAFPLSATGFAAAKQTNSQGQLIAQAQGQGQGQRQGHKDRFAALNLSQTQKDQIAQIRKDSRAEMEGIISKDQRDKYKAAIASGQNRRAAKAAMNITADQKARIKALKTASKAKIQAVLTDTQRQQLQQMSPARRQQG